jgi:carbon starvation protein
MPPFAVALFHYNQHGQLVLHAMPIMVGALCVLAIAYRYYSAFLAAKVAVLNDSRVTPAVRLNDGQNYHPTSKWVLFGHHFAAISGAGPLIGPVLALQYGYMPGLLWLIVGVCLAGAVQDMLVLAASVRRDGKSLAEIARRELGGPASVVASIAILFIIVIALAGLGIVVVKALGGEEAKLPAGMRITSPAAVTEGGGVYQFPAGCQVRYSPNDSPTVRSEAFAVRCPAEGTLGGAAESPLQYTLPAGCTQVIPGSSWGTFTIACTIPIALLVGLWMYRIRPGKVVEASLVGGAMTLGAVVLGGFVPGSSLEPYFSLTRTQTIWALCIYGFFAAVLPVWLLLGPRDYLSSFLKIGTVILLVVSVCVANPPLEAPKFNAVFMNGGPTFKAGGIFPFVFICVMCGAVSGFHALVSSGTTPKMVEKESHIRTIGYGAMLIEGLVGITALIAAAALPNTIYYDINVAIDDLPQYSEQVKEVEAKYGDDPLHAANANGLGHLGQIEEKVGGESLRGRTGGAVTLAVGMSVVFEDAFRTFGVTADWLLKYWYHFAIMFEALFILTTIDAGTRIGRFLLQETVGRAYPPFARPGWLPGALIASGVITAGWGWLIHSGSVATIWPMFGIANQALAVLALALVTTWLVNIGRAKFAFVTLLPMLWVSTTTLSAGYLLVSDVFPRGNAIGKMSDTALALNIGLVVFVLSSVFSLVLWAAARWVLVLTGKIPTRTDG